MKHTLKLLTALLLAPLATQAAEPSADLLEDRGLPHILYNNDSDDLKFPAYPEYHDALWAPLGSIPLPVIRSLDDYLASRIGPLAKTKTQGLSYCGNFGAPVWELKRDQIAALGDDPLQPILQFWKRDGRKFFFSMRMNDDHHSRANWAHLWDDFRRTHRHWFLKPPTDTEWETQYLPWLEDKTPPAPGEWIAKVKTRPKVLGIGQQPAIWDGLRYDYSKQEVRTHYLELVREACRRYDLDGVELDFMRGPKYFRDGEVDAATMTAFVTEVRAIVDESAKSHGRPIRLVARVPDRIAGALAFGLDVEAWLKKGLLDAVIPGEGNHFDNTKLEEWVELAHRYHTPVYGPFKDLTPPRRGTPESYRAAAATLWEKGADGLYFFNYYNRDKMPLIDELADRAKLASLSKEYQIEALPFNPLTLKPGTPATVQLLICDDPAKAKETSLEVVFKGEGEFEPPKITLNGHPLSEMKSTRGKVVPTRGLIMYPSNEANLKSTSDKADIPVTFVTLSSADLKKTLKRGTNDFSFISPASATLTSLNVRVVP
jgi:hypothetical protein